MSLESLHQKVLQVARNNPPSDDVPYAFEKRVMAHLLSVRAQAIDPWLLISQGLWRAVIPCFAFTVMLSCWSWNQGGTASDSGVNGLDDLEVALVDSIDLNDNVEDGL